jgi:hypothetical protein
MLPESHTRPLIPAVRIYENVVPKRMNVWTLKPEETEKWRKLHNG